MEVPGKYAPTVQECKSDKPFQPLAVRQHALGPYPFDPNLIAQGVPPDQRVTVNDNIFGPTEGTPLPPELGQTPPGPPPIEAPLPPAGAPPPPADGQIPPAAPSGFASGDPASGPSVAVAHYDPQTGRVATPAGEVFEQTDVTSTGAPKSWQDLLLSADD